MWLVRGVALMGAALALACGGEEDRPRPRRRPTPTVPVPGKAPAAPDAGADAGTAASGDAANAAPGGDAGGAALFEREVAARKLLATARRSIGEKQTDAALAALKQARDTLPEDAAIRAELARACLDAGDVECARTEAQAAIEKGEGLAATQARAWELVGQIGELSGAVEDALTAYQKALRLQPAPVTAGKIAKLSKAAGGGAEDLCHLGGPAAVRAVELAEETAEAHGKQICPLLAEPLIERDGGGFPVETFVIAALSKNAAAADVLRSSAGLAAESSFAVLLVRIEREQTSVVTLDSGARPGRENEVVSEISSEVRRVTLGPSRPGLVVEVVTKGWWDLGSGLTPFGFERHELYLAGRQLNRWGKLVSQVTVETGHKAVDDCVHGPSSRPVSRGGAIWLEDLDLSGVPEICRETSELRADGPSWTDGTPARTRVEAECQSWVASSLSKSDLPVPSLELDEFDQDRSVHSILEVSRVPEQIRGFVKTDLDGATIIAARALDVVKSGMRALAVVSDVDGIKAMAVSGDEATAALDLGKTGRWREIWADIDTTDPGLISVEVTARGDDLDGASTRRWLHLIATGPGEPPRLALSEELLVETPAGADPCPSIITAEVERETKESVLYVAFKRRRQTGPGLLALEKTRQAVCDSFASWLHAGPDAPLPATVGSLQPAEALCPGTIEELEKVQYAQGADRRLVRTTTVMH